MDSTNSPTTKPLYHAIQVVWYLLGGIEVLLMFRFLLKFFGANDGSGFASFIYAVSMPFIVPFTSVFGISRLDDRLLEWTTLLAMIVYLLIGWGVVTFLLMGKTVSTSEAANKLT